MAVFNKEYWSCHCFEIVLTILMSFIHASCLAKVAYLIYIFHRAKLLMFVDLYIVAKTHFLSNAFVEMNDYVIVQNVSFILNMIIILLMNSSVRSKLKYIKPCHLYYNYYYC